MWYKIILYILYVILWILSKTLCKGNRCITKVSIRLNRYVLKLWTILYFLPIFDQMQSEK